MRNIILFICVVFLSANSFAQWGNSGTCHENANTSDNWASGRKAVIDASFKFFPGGNCSATLINRNTSDDNVGFYFITARHCLSADALNNDNYIDLNINYKFMFNYQSPNGNTSSAASTNQGISSQQIQSTQLSDQGYEYLHYSKIRIVADYFWGDFALCEILTPLPPHFKVEYAGWNPSAFYFSQPYDPGNPPPCFLPNEFVGVHHPKGDIKKINGTTKVKNLTNPIATNCYTITTVIDILLGWIWGNQYSTQVICNYVDNPWYVVPIWCYGGVEGGSSGSGLFNGNNKFIGPLSGGLFDCSTVNPTTYGKLRSNYSHANVKSVLNPSNDMLVDLVGMDGRSIVCYEDLVLPGVITNPVVSGEYFPANHYQQNNQIVLRAQNDISTNAPIRVYSGADYQFLAGSKITLGNGFKVESGAKFVAAISGCTRQSVQSPEQTNIHNMLSAIQIPQHKEFNIIEHKKATEIKLITELYPNPNRGIFNLSINNVNTTLKTIKVIDVMGKIIWEQNNFVENNIEVDISAYSNGIYYLQAYSNDGIVETKKIIKY